jgi:hypothetical protein
MLIFDKKFRPETLILGLNAHLWIRVVLRTRSAATGGFPPRVLRGSSGRPAGGRVFRPQAIQAWLEQTVITTGPLFRAVSRHGQVQADRLSGIDVARVVKKLSDRAGLDSAKYAGHSLRAGTPRLLRLGALQNGAS